MERKKTRWRDEVGLTKGNPQGKAKRGEIKRGGRKPVLMLHGKVITFLWSKHTPLPLTHQESFVQMTSDILFPKYAQIQL